MIDKLDSRPGSQGLGTGRVEVHVSTRKIEEVTAVRFASGNV